MEKLYLGKIENQYELTEEIIKKNNIRVGMISPFTREVVISRATAGMAEPDIVEVVTNDASRNIVDIIEIKDDTSDVDIIEIKNNDVDIVEIE